ncbi:MAG: hypothetical protein WCB18_01220 [Thermoplasmata archaeon]
MVATVTVRSQEGLFESAKGVVVLHLDSRVNYCGRAVFQGTLDELCVLLGRKRPYPPALLEHLVPDRKVPEPETGA